MKITKCVIPIAGRGTRFLPITKTVSKEMLPIVDKPTILLQVLEAYQSGINEIIFIVGKHNINLVKNFFTENKELDDFLGQDEEKKNLLNVVKEIIKNVQFHYVYQDDNLKGTAGALYQAKDYFKEDEYFAVMFGDDLIDSEVPVIKQMIDEYDKYHCNIIGSCNIAKENVSKYGVLEIDSDNYITNIIEKPSIEEAPSTLISTGRFIISSEVFSIIKTLTPVKNEYLLVDGILNMKTKSKAYLYDGTYYDIGSKYGYIKANINYGLKNNQVKEDLLNYINTLRK